MYISHPPRTVIFVEFVNLIISARPNHGMLHAQEGDTHSKQVETDTLPLQANMRGLEEGVKPDTRRFKSEALGPVFPSPRTSQTLQQTALHQQPRSARLEGIYIVHLVRRVFNGRSAVPVCFLPMKFGLDLVFVCFHVDASAWLPSAMPIMALDLTRTHTTAHTQTRTNTLAVYECWCRIGTGSGFGGTIRRDERYKWGSCSQGRTDPNRCPGWVFLAFLQCILVEASAVGLLSHKASP